MRSRGRLPKIFDIRRPSFAAGGDIEAMIACLDVQERESMPAVVHWCQALDTSRRRGHEAIEDSRRAHYSYWVRWRCTWGWHATNAEQRASFLFFLFIYFV